MRPKRNRRNRNPQWIQRDYSFSHRQHFLSANAAQNSKKQQKHLSTALFLIIDTFLRHLNEKCTSIQIERRSNEISIHLSDVKRSNFRIHRLLFISFWRDSITLFVFLLQLRIGMNADEIWRIKYTVVLSTC